MSSYDERFAEIERNWFDADDNYEQDFNTASTYALKQAITANRNTAYTTYIAAFHNALTRNGDDIERIYQDLVIANQEVKRSRQELERIPQLLKKLSRGTAKAAELVVNAKN